MNSYRILLISSAIGFACASAQIIRQLDPPTDPGAKILRVHSTWTIFMHPRYGFHLPVPPGVGALGNPDASNEPQFRSADGTFVMSAWGGTSYELPAKVFADQWETAQHKAGRDITYVRRGKTWFVVSGTDVRGIEFYEKFTMNGQQVAFLNITFPKTRIRQYGGWVEQIEDGFRPVMLSDGPAESPPQLARSRAVADVGKTAPEQAEAGVRRTYDEQKPSADLARTPPAPKDEFTFTEPTPKKLTEAPPAPSRERLPSAEKVLGKPGFVYSPYGAERRIVDVKGMPSGTTVKCPYTKKNFRIP